MEKKETIKAQIEAILFAMGDAVEGDRMAEALQITEEELTDIVNEMMEEYRQSSRGIMISKVDRKYQLCTKVEHYETLIRLCHVPKKHVLTDVLLETLSIIAYKQPVTRQEIEAIRGVGCDFAINKLMDYHLICELGRMDAPGRPILFGTTDDFLRSFGVSSLDELPIVDSTKIDEFKMEAEEETTVGV